MTGTCTLAFHPKERGGLTHPGGPHATDAAQTVSLETVVSPTSKWPYKLYCYSTSLSEGPDDSGPDLLEGAGESHGIKTVEDLVSVIPMIFANEVLASDCPNQCQNSDNKDHNNERFPRSGIYALSIDVDTGSVILVHEVLDTPNSEVPALITESKNRFNTLVEIEHKCCSA